MAERKKDKKQFICPECDYKAWEKARLKHCPLCIICKGCGERVEDCSCIEGE